MFGSVVQWLGHATVNRSIGVQVPADPFGNKARSFISYLVSGRYRNFRLLADWSKRVGDCGACVSSPEQRDAQKDVLHTPAEK